MWWGKFATAAQVQTSGPCKGRSRPGNGQLAVDSLGKVMRTRVRTDGESATGGAHGNLELFIGSSFDFGVNSESLHAFGGLLASEYFNHFVVRSSSCLPGIHEHSLDSWPICPSGTRSQRSSKCQRSSGHAVRQKFLPNLSCKSFYVPLVQRGFPSAPVSRAHIRL